MTPTRALVVQTTLQGLVRDGIQALRTPDAKLIQSKVRAALCDSLDLDAALKGEYPSAPRWDYLLGHSPSNKVVGLEPHSAKSDEVNLVIRKKKNALDQLKGRTASPRRVERWFWVASGSVQFPDIDRTQKRLAQENIVFVGRELHEKHFRGL